ALSMLVVFLCLAALYESWSIPFAVMLSVPIGIFGALLPVIVSDLTQGTGRFNVTLGAVSTAFGLGAAFSPGLAGLIVQFAGYDVAFLTLAAIAALAFVLAMAMPETRPQASDTAAEPATTASNASL
ncbi:MAG: efflux RND transporter permease subunit, partial [Stenotrophomonas sp.]